MIIIGIDPGASGGIASICRGDRVLKGHETVEKLQPTESDILSTLCDLHSGSTSEEHVIAYLEKVASMPGQGVSSTFKFGQNYGFLRGCLVSLGIPFVDVRPQTWQRGVGIPALKGETKTAKKNRHKQLAQQLFPQLAKQITHATADALLIAEYGRRLKAGEL